MNIRGESKLQIKKVNFRGCAVGTEIESSELKNKYSLLYRTHPQSLLVLWPCYVITYVRWSISFEEMCVTLGCCITGL